RARATQQGWMPEVAPQSTWTKEHLIGPRLTLRQRCPALAVPLEWFRAAINAPLFTVNGAAIQQSGGSGVAPTPTPRFRVEWWWRKGWPMREFEHVAQKPPRRVVYAASHLWLWKPDTRRYTDSPPPLNLEGCRRGPRAIVSYGRAAATTCCIGEGGRRHDRACLHRGC
ncbi:MAG TPA: hypothetical protein VGB13_00780, partial [Candidatus Krumholzibacteria bacterium]